MALSRALLQSTLISARVLLSRGRDAVLEVAEVQICGLVELHAICMNGHDGERMNGDSISIVGQQARSLDSRPVGNGCVGTTSRVRIWRISRAGLSASATGRSRSGLSSTAPKSGEI